MEPTVTVILPAFNADRYIAKAVRSILDQTFADFEMVIINDGSTDKTLSILQDFARSDNRIKLISRPNTGYVVALNEGLSHARGKYIARMDADDICLPTRFEKQVAYLDENADCVLIGANVEHIDQSGAVIGPMSDIAYGSDQINAALLRGGWPLVHPAVMMRTAVVRELGGYLPEYCPNEDHDLFLKLGEVGRLENLPDVLVMYRKHAASASAIHENRIRGLIGRIVISACRRRGIPVPAEILNPQSKPQPAKVDVERIWAWHAVKHRNLATARKYAWATLVRRPFSIESWRLTYCAVRGR